MKTELTFSMLGAKGGFAIIRGKEAVYKRVLYRLRTRLGEWTYDTTLGLDYLGAILVDRPNFPRIQSSIVALVAATEGVVRVTSVELDLNREGTLVADIRFVVEDEQNGERSQAPGELLVDFGELNMITQPIGPIV